MKILFFSNYFNHHQQSLADALWALTGGHFCFLESESISQERLSLGWRVPPRSYVLPLAGNEALAKQWLREADVVIAGSAPEHWVRQRIRTGKLLLRYSERPLPNGPEPLKYLPRLLKWHWRNPPFRPIYLLCASAFAAADYGRFGLFRRKCYCWGYFPETRRYEGLPAGKDPREILWCGRMTALKHPEDALEAARQLAKEGLPFHMTLLGSGEEGDNIRQRIRRFGLEDRVSFPGAGSPETVRRAMEHAGIFLFTSDRREGWGVVLNEAMNSGCAVIASDAIGAVPWLVRSGENGLTYPSGDVEALTEALRDLLTAPQRQKRLGLAAYETIAQCWNAEEAARRLLRLSEALLAGEDPAKLYSFGPCAPVKEDLP